MRAILVLFLTSSILDDGWGWERDDALILYGWYTGLVYFTPLIGGILADKYFGYRVATIIGAFIMTMGHGSMALEFLSENFFYLGIALLIIGNGFFKPNISSIVGQLYKTEGKDKDAGYTITTHEGINKTKSIRPLLFNIPLLFTQMDMLNLQYATVAKFDR